MPIRRGATWKPRAGEGTKNFVALDRICPTESEIRAEPILILKDALTIDPKYAQAHWVFGEKLNDPPRRMMEWKQAVNLAPRNYEWWAQYAQLCVDQKQYAEAGRAWVAAAQAAPDVQRREKYLDARGRIEEQRLDAEEEERRRDAEAKTKEMDRLKAEARKELADLEARANTRPLSKDDLAKTVPYFDDTRARQRHRNPDPRRLQRETARLNVKGDDGITKVLLVPDSSQFLTMGDMAPCPAACKSPAGSRWHKGVEAANASGEATGMEYEP